MSGFTTKLSAAFLIIAFQLTATIEGCSALEVKGTAEVVDGDTIEIDSVRIRLFGIDAAESRQRCVTVDRKIARPGDTAKALLSKLVVTPVRCKGNEFDDYGRLIATCTDAKGSDINRQMVADGWAWAFVKYTNNYVADERGAKAKRLGIWAMSCDTPWDFRARRWKSAQQKAPAGCPIKGNISAQGKIYHVPWDRDYPKTRVNRAKGERWFCSEKEAIEAGWRAPRG